MKVLIIISLCLLTCSACPAQDRGWKGIVPLHSSRADVEKAIGLPTERLGKYSDFYWTQKETVILDYTSGRRCGIGEKYDQWRVPGDTVENVMVTMISPIPLSSLGIDETKYKKRSGGHLPQEIYYVNNEGGESIRVFAGEVQGIDYYPAKSDYPLACPGLMLKQGSDCEGLTPPRFDFYGNINYGDEKARLDNFVITLMDDKDRTGYIVAYGGKRARPREAKTRAERAKNYLVTVRHFPANRLKAIDGGYRQQPEVDLYVVPEGVCPPIAVPTVDPRDVRIVKQIRAR